MAEVDKSIKLVFNEFQQSIAEVPLEVYYQTLNADQFNSAGYQFNIKQPGAHALLDTDIWIEFNLRIKETAASAIRGMFEANATNPNGYSLHVPQNANILAYRSGYIVQRCTQNFSIQINNQTLNVRPNYYVDVLNRLFVSNDQAEHEFSTSGGRFEEGNHGHRLCNPCLSNPNSGEQAAAAYAGGDQSLHYSTMIADAVAMKHDAAAAGTNACFVPYIFAGLPWESRPLPAVFPTGQTVYIYAWPEYPNRYEFTNPGLDKRWCQMALRVRQNLNYLDAGGSDSAADPATGVLMIGDAQVPAVANQRVYTLKVFERLPISLFKMFSNDDVYGVLPNIIQMQIQGNFVNNMAALLLRSNTNAPAVDMYWTDITTAHCKIYLRWFTGPKSMPIPREIHVPYKKIVTWSIAAPILATNAAAGANFVDQTPVSYYNISIESIPDLLLIYMRMQAGNYTFDTPDDFNMEIRDLSINIDNASGKLNQIQSIDLYNKWKRLLKHSDNKIIGYEEWRRYCCVACLQPEDYGVRYGPGYSNPCVLGLKFTPRNWHINPSIHSGPPYADGNAQVAPGAVGTNQEFLGGAAGAGTQTELVVTQIFYKNKLIIRADGTCSQEMTKIAADFDMRAPDIESGGMGAAGYGIQNA